MENDIINKTIDYIRKSRLYSYSVTVVTILLLIDTLNWVYSLTPQEITSQVVALATSILTALVALLKFTFNFAAYNPDKEK